MTGRQPQPVERVEREGAKAELVEGFIGERNPREEAQKFHHARNEGKLVKNARKRLHDLVEERAGCRHDPLESPERAWQIAGNLEAVIGLRDDETLGCLQGLN